MADRTRDIVRLREAARLCRVKEAAGDGAAPYGRIAEEIDGLICRLSAEKAMRQAATLRAAALWRA